MRQLAQRSAAAIAVLTCMLSTAEPARAASTQLVNVSANVVKPLSLARVQDLDLGTIVLRPGTWSNAAVTITRAGLFTCTSTNLTCTGATQVAKYTVTGSNNQVVHITAPNVTLVNQSDASKTLTLVVDNPGAVTMPNSGNQGVTFSLGGSISLSSAAADGIYQGSFNVTVDY